MARRRSPEQLCPQCQKTGRCRFEERAERLARSAWKKYRRARTDEYKLLIVQDAHEEMEKLRREYRDRFCRSLNDVNPDLPPIPMVEE